MINSVSFSGSTTDINQPKKTSPTKKGAMIGAGVGLAHFAARTYQARNFLKDNYKLSIACGVPKKATIASFAAMLAVMSAVGVGIGSLIGAGVGKIVGHFSKSDNNTVMPEEKKIDNQA